MKHGTMRLTIHHSSAFHVSTVSAGSAFNSTFSIQHSPFNIPVCLLTSPLNSGSPFAARGAIHRLLTSIRRPGGDKSGECT